MKKILFCYIRESKGGGRGFWRDIRHKHGLFWSEFGQFPSGVILLFRLLQDDSYALESWF